MDGLSAIRHIRAREDAKAAMPIIVVTADTAHDLRARCLEAGADEVLFKPVAMDSLFDAIGRLMARGTPDGEIGRAHVELQSLMRISYAVFCLKKKKKTSHKKTHYHNY